MIAAYITVTDRHQPVRLFTGGIEPAWRTDRPFRAAFTVVTAAGLQRRAGWHGWPLGRIRWTAGSAG